MAWKLNQRMSLSSEEEQEREGRHFWKVIQSDKNNVFSNCEWGDLPPGGHGHLLRLQEDGAHPGGACASQGAGLVGRARQRDPGAEWDSGGGIGSGGDGAHGGVHPGGGLQQGAVGGDPDHFVDILCPPDRPGAGPGAPDAGDQDHVVAQGKTAICPAVSGCPDHGGRFRAGRLHDRLRGDRPAPVQVCGGRDGPDGGVGLGGPKAMALSLKNSSHRIVVNLSHL